MKVNHNIEKDLANHICKTCNNLSYWDGYYCKLGKHQTKREKLNGRPLKCCDKYEKKYGKNWEGCKTQECIFWCSDCPAYPK